METVGPGTLSRVLAASFALAAFAVAIVAGLSGGNPATTILVRALIAMMICYPVGLIVGLVCERVVTLHAEAHERANPSGDEGDGPFGPAEAAEVEDEEEVITV